MLVGLLLLGHVCDLSAFAPVDAHHSVDHHGDGHEQISSCDTMPATPSPVHAHVWTVLDLGPAVQMPPARLAARPVDRPASLADRPPLFLLHASLLI
jgi:hypothetical protein